MQMIWFCAVISIEVCRRKCLKVNPGESKVMVLKGEEGLEYEVSVDGM